MSRLAFRARRLALPHKRRHFYSNEDSLRDEPGAILAAAHSEQGQAHRHHASEKDA